MAMSKYNKNVGMNLSVKPAELSVKRVGKSLNVNRQLVGGKKRTSVT